ncbi:hypothetical protein QZH41_016221 [Actinostola sp. cb2023]|nr:hypothetical protein QZH41_016221 [Actinostola sp. cb2023]
MVSIRELIDNLRATKPPYECPLCQKFYKSYSGIEYHLQNFKHDGSDVPLPPSSSKKSKGRGRKSVKTGKNKRPPPSPPQVVVRETLTYAQAQLIVEVELEGLAQRIGIDDSLEVFEEQGQELEKGEASIQHVTPKPITKTKNKSAKNEVERTPSLPKSDYVEKGDFRHPDAPTRPTTYFRFIEQTTEEMDENVEYDMDEEDYSWLDLINEQRKSDNIAPVSQEVFENLMDRLEKESYFQSQTTCDPNQYIDEDAVCCICNDGECQNSNVILFCDMCNLAVHQECYGVPYIPEGQWLCRRCLQSPSRAVDCALCPNKTGAFKQTDDGRWGHVVCALWIPEVCFANTVFLEPIDSIENIPSARWKLTCYICKRRQGASIQCFKTNCYTAFHVTCAQQAGLFMKIEPIKAENGQLTVRKTAYCDVHSPGNLDQEKEVENDSEEKLLPIKSKLPTKNGTSKRSIKKFRKLLAEKKTMPVPVVNIPFIPAHRLGKIVSKVAMARKAQFVQALQSYWMLKRQSRNGVPLLRRLQATHLSQKGGGDESSERSERIKAMKEQLHFWQRLRHDLERARLLVELIRKREKLKREHVKAKQHVVDLQLQPLNLVLRKAMDQIQTKDPGDIFSEPVDPSEVPDYLDVIETPMDFSCMRSRIESNFYHTVDQFEADFNLVIENCMQYNAPDTIYYRASLKLRDQGRPIIRASRRQVERAGIDPMTGLHTKEAPTLADREPTEEGVRATRVRMVRKEMALVRRKLNQERRRFSESSVGTANDDRHSKPFDICTSEDSTTEQPPSKKQRLEDTPGPEGDMATAHTHGTITIEPKAAIDSAASTATTNPSPGMSRRSGILFNKGRSRVRRNLNVASEKYLNDVASIANHVLQPVNHEKNTEITITESQITQNHRTDVTRNSDVFLDEKNPIKEPSHKWRNDSLSSNEGTYTHRKPYKTELGKLIEDATSPLYESHSDKLSFAFTNGLRQRNYRTYTSESESDNTDVRANGGRQRRKGRLFSSMSEDEQSTTDTEVSAMENRAVNGPIDESNKKKRPRKTTTDSDMDLTPLEPLELVWAKCRGYPSYPALIIDPKIKKGLIYNGIPIPAPPEEVMREKSVTDDSLYLVLFFDTRRTWQWLPRHKLELLGTDKARDESKLLEGKKLSMKKSLQQAYERAIMHQNQVEAGRRNMEADDEDDDDDLSENGFD